METQGGFAGEALAHMDELRRFAYGMCGNEHRTADLVQETMLKAFGNAHAYTPGTNCRAWLFRICRNSFLTERRRSRLMPIATDFTAQGEGEGAERERLPAAHPWHDDDPARHDGAMADEVHTALAALPSPYSTAVILCDLEGYTYEEVATFAGAPIGTVRARIHRGRRMLARLLEDYGKTRGGRQAVADAPATSSVRTTAVPQ